MNDTSTEVFHLFKGVPWLITYICEAVLILTGNSITIYIFWSIRKRMKRTSYLLINLAAADFLVGISISVFLFLHIASVARTLVIGNTVVKIGVFVDAVGVTSSILSLALISLERMFAMLWPFRHRTVNTWYYHLSVGIVWLLACFNGVVNVAIDLYRTESQDGFSYLMAITPSSAPSWLSLARIWWFGSHWPNAVAGFVTTLAGPWNKTESLPRRFLSWRPFQFLPVCLLESFLLLEITCKICTPSGYKSLL